MDEDRTKAKRSDATAIQPNGALWSIIICYYNEEAFIERTLACVTAQRDASFQLILVNNASTDQSEKLCRDYFAGHPDITPTYLNEAQPGHAYALDAGYRAVKTPFVSFWDADTFYPDHYLATAEQILSDRGCVAAMAIDIYSPPNSLTARLHRWRMKLTSHILKYQAHTGTFGQNFKMDALRATGGPSSETWPFVLEDHELIHRILKQGGTTYSPNLWCMPLPRRKENAHVRWSLSERLLYHFSPFILKDWFFYTFLKNRFEKRGLFMANLRVRDWV